MAEKIISNESDRAEYFVIRTYPNGDILNTQLDIYTVRPLSNDFYSKLLALIILDLDKSK